MMFKNNKTVLLLTGTINTSGVSFMERIDVQVRLNDYVRAIKKWILHYPDLKIVFVENSNHPSNELGTDILNHSNFEYLSYHGQKFSRDKGKGYGEISSFEYAFQNSKFLTNCKFVIKCNGRYFFKGINKFIETDNYLVGDFRKNLTYFDSRVFGFNKDFFLDYFLSLKEDINDSEKSYFEHVLARAVHKAMSEKKSWSSISFPLVIQGFSGTGNYKYDTVWTKLISYVRFQIKKFLV